MISDAEQRGLITPGKVRCLILKTLLHVYQGLNKELHNAYMALFHLPI